MIKLSSPSVCVHMTRKELLIKTLKLNALKNSYIRDGKVSVDLQELFCYNEVVKITKSR